MDINVRHWFHPGPAPVDPVMAKLNAILSAVQALQASLVEQQALAAELKASTAALHQAVISNQPKE